LGILLAVCEASAILSPFVMGYFADRFRCYRPVLLISFFMSLFCGVILFLSKNLLLCAIVLPVLAFFYRAVQPLMDAISTIKLGKEGNYGKYRALGSLVFFALVIFFQFTPVFVPDTPKNIAFWVAVCGFVSIGLVTLIPRPYFINDSKPVYAAENRKAARLRHGAGYKLWSPLFIIGFAIIFLNRLAMAPINGFLSLYVIEYLKWDAVGLMWALSSGSEMAFIFLSKRLIRRFGALPLMAFATLAILVRYAIILLFPTNGGIAVSQMTHSVCYGIFHPAAVYFIASCVPPERRALGMSLYLSLGTGVPTLIGNVIGGFLVEYYGYHAMFMFFAVFAVIGALVYFITKKHTLRLSAETAY
jgi:PPP family 3-phenylpropionic acid transporter